MKAPFSTDPVIRRHLCTPTAERFSADIIRKRKLAFWSLAVAAWLTIILVSTLF